MTNAQLVNNLKDRVELVEEICRSIGADPKLIEDELATYIKDIGVYVANSRTIHITETKKQA